MFGLSLGHLVLLLVIVLLLRAKHLPEIAQGMRRSIDTFKRGWKGEELEKNPERKEVNGPLEADAVLPAQKSKQPKGDSSD